VASLEIVIARAIRAERARLGLRQDELAERLGWARQTLSTVESGARRITVNDLPLLCDALGVPLAELIRGAEPDDLARLRL